MRLSKSPNQLGLDRRSDVDSLTMQQLVESIPLRSRRRARSSEGRPFERRLPSEPDEDEDEVRLHMMYAREGCSLQLGHENHHSCAGPAHGYFCHPQYCAICSIKHVRTYNSCDRCPYHGGD